MCSRHPLFPTWVAFLQAAHPAASVNLPTATSQQVVKSSPVRTFASATFSSLLDVLLSTTVFLILSITCFLRYGAASTPPPPAALAVFGAALLLEILSLVVSVR